jgi:quercetin dioxygenase-like cupin family protein
MFKVLMRSLRHERHVVGTAPVPAVARRRFLQALGGTAFSVNTAAWAQSPQAAPKLMQILRADLEGQNQRVEETVVNILEMAPGVGSPWHMHPGAQETIFVLEGSLQVEIGEHAAQEVKAGAIILIPAEIPHLARNDGFTLARALVTHSRADKEKPFLVALKRPA